MWEKIKAFFAKPKLIEQFHAIEAEITPEIEKVAVEIKKEVKKRGRKKKT